MLKTGKNDSDALKRVVKGMQKERESDWKMCYQMRQDKFIMGAF